MLVFIVSFLTKTRNIYFFSVAININDCIKIDIYYSNYNLNACFYIRLGFIYHRKKSVC